jgi:poly-gamma-glutamate capsule biosynthesis protein CapA/YwtB (metallophosphatase superfamily)
MQPVKLFLCGDVMTGRGVDQILPHPSNPELHEPYVRSAVEYVSMAERMNGIIPKPVSFSYIWGDALEELDRAKPDARIVNLETSVTTSDAWLPKGINYRMHPANSPCLQAAKIDCCVLANNHVLDWGRPGLAETLTMLRKHSIKTAGAGLSAAQASAPATLCLDDDRRILVFSTGAADSGIAHDWAATTSRAGVALLPGFSAMTADSIGQRVQAVKRAGDLAILSIHWGGNWGYAVSAEHHDFAHHLVDRAGIDLIHGHSSHHPKGIEVYKDRLILYGCGDFIDDYEGIAGYEEFRSHLVLTYLATLDPDGGKLLSLAMHSFQINRFRLERAGKSDVEWLRDTLNRTCKQFGSTILTRRPGELTLAWDGG